MDSLYLPYSYPRLRLGLELGLPSYTRLHSWSRLPLRLSATPSSSLSLSLSLASSRGDNFVNRNHNRNSKRSHDSICKPNPNRNLKVLDGSSIEFSRTFYHTLLSNGYNGAAPTVREATP